MTAAWHDTPLAELVDFQRGLTYAKTDEVDSSNNIVLRATNIDLKTNALDLSELRYISDKVTIPPNKIVKKGSLLICTASGSKSHLGKVALIDDDYGFAFGGFMGMLTPRDIVLPKYLFYAMTSQQYKDFIDKLADGANINNLKFDDLSAFTVPILPIAEQKRIVAILDQCFEAIETAKANAEKNLLNADELFNSYLSSYSTKTVPLGNLVDITTGKLDANAAVESGQYPFFTCAKEVYAINKYAFDCQAILLAGNNAVGDFNVKHFSGKFNAYQRTYVITVKDGAPLTYRHLYFQLVKNLGTFKASSVGVGTKFLKLGMIKELRIALPTTQEQDRLTATLDRLRGTADQLLDINAKRIMMLGELKSALLSEAYGDNL